MVKEFCLTVDVTMSGDIYIEAETEEEARRKFVERYFVASDLRNFCQVDKKIVYITKDV